MDLVDFFSKENQTKNDENQKKDTTIKIKAAIFNALKGVAEPNGLKATSLANLILADFVDRLKKKKKDSDNRGSNGYHNPEFDIDDDTFQGVI
jgi:hypothetical protein